MSQRKNSIEKLKNSGPKVLEGLLSGGKDWKDSVPKKENEIVSETQINDILPEEEFENKDKNDRKNGKNRLKFKKDKDEFAKKNTRKSVDKLKIEEPEINSENVLTEEQEKEEKKETKKNEFEELTDKINNYIIETKNKTLTQEQFKKELEKIKEMGGKAGYFLGNAEKYAETRHLNDKEMIVMCGELKEARNELRRLYIEIANKEKIEKK